ncbi:MAG: signal peptide peptidase SppA, partial [Bdellovibrionales bacterium]|nr:signal peptide peptidase SppA [Bdellovibrionales bacterium]
VLVALWNPLSPEVDEPSLLSMRLDGVILDSTDFVTTLRTYREDPNIKGVIIHINSPGGLVGTSQELYTEIKRVREESRKPVVVAGGSVVASGAYYAAAGADRIVANPGTLMGSIGVIMEFANLKGLFDLAKVDRYILKNGDFKDAGSDLRRMNPEERDLFQGILEEVHDQFKLAVQRSRRLSPDIVNKYGDGRIFTGETAVRLGFADQVGTYEDALRVAGNLAGLGPKPKVFSPGNRTMEWLNSIKATSSAEKRLEALADKYLHMHLVGKPLYLMPGIL